MIRRFGLFLLTLPVAAAVPAVSAQAQYYPAPPPYYRGAPPPGIYQDRLPAPSYYADDDDDAPVVRRPSRDPRYSQMPPQDQRGPSDVPKRILPYPDEADAAVPPPPGFARPYGEPPAYGHQLDAQSPQPAARQEPDVIRPPAAIGAAPNTAPQQ